MWYKLGVEVIRDTSRMRPTGSREARNFLARRLEARESRFLAGVWGLVIGVMGYVLIFKP